MYNRRVERDSIEIEFTGEGSVRNDLCTCTRCLLLLSASSSVRFSAKSKSNRVWIVVSTIALTVNGAELCAETPLTNMTGPTIRKRNMKRRTRLADLDLTNQRSLQLRSIFLPHIRAFWMWKQQCRSRLEWFFFVPQ